MISVSVILAAPLICAQFEIAEIAGDGGLEAVVGNGALTAGFDSYGALIQFRWPSPGYCDHLGYVVEPDGARPPDQGAMWAVEVDGRLQWLRAGDDLEARWLPGEPSSAALELHDVGRGLTYQLEAFVTVNDVLVQRIRVTGADRPPRVFWYANFAPCTTLVPRLPIADWLLDPWNDFGVFAVDKGRSMIHFRPKDPGQDEWDRLARMLRENRSSGEWGAFPDGVYIAYGAGQHVASFQCGNESGASSAFAAANSSRLQPLPSATGQCNSAIEIIPDSRDRAFEASVFVAVAANAGSAIGALDAAREAGSQTLQEDIERVWRAVISQAKIPDALPEDIWTRCQDAIATIVVCTDRETGAVVRSPSTQPPLALNAARFAVWINLALDSVGLHGFAFNNLKPLLESIRETDDSGPRGSMPAALYSNGTPALPDFILDVENTGWLLWSAHRHYVAEGSGADVLSMWPKLTAAADFLAGWADPRSGAPLHSFDWSVLHDRQTPRTALVSFLGLDAACRLADLLEQEIPDWWLRRRDELDVWIQLRQLHGLEDWDKDDEMVFWLTEQGRRPWAASGAARPSAPSRQILAPGDPHWLAAASALLDESEGLPAHLRDAAWLSHHADPALVRVEALRAYSKPFMDALDAANYLLAALAIAGQVPAAAPEQPSAPEHEPNGAEGIAAESAAL